MLIRGSADSEARTLTMVGSTVVLCVALAAVVFLFANPFQDPRTDRISVAIKTQYVGQGVAKGTAVVMHGVQVGEVTAISSLPGGGVLLNTTLQKEPVAGLTDTFKIDFRPVNYFGITGLNLLPGAGGHALRDGTQVSTAPQGNFTLQALLSRLGELSRGVLTPQLIQVIDRTTQYTDALNPLIETALIAANAIADTQTVRTAQLLTNAASLSTAFPPFVDAMTDAGIHFLYPDNYTNTAAWDDSDEYFENRTIKTLEMSQGDAGIFGHVGKLESSHVSDLLPVIESLKALTDVVPPLIRPESVAQTLVELRSRLQKLYAGTPEQRALQVRIVLDSLPGVAAPLAAMGGPE